MVTFAGFWLIWDHSVGVVVRAVISMPVLYMRTAYLIC